MPVRQSFTHRQAPGPRRFPEKGDRLSAANCRTSCCLHGVFELRGLLRPAKLAQQLFAGNAAVRRAAGDPREGPARTHDGIQQPAGCPAIAKFQAVGNEGLHSEMMGERPKYVLKQLPDQDDARSAANRFDQFLHGLAAQLRLQHVVKILFAKKIEPIAAHASQQRVQKPRSKGAVRGIGEGPQQRHRRHTRAPRPALRKALRVPGEESHRAHRAEFQ